MELDQREWKKPLGLIFSGSRQFLFLNLNDVHDMDWSLVLQMAGVAGFVDFMRLSLTGWLLDKLGI